MSHSYQTTGQSRHSFIIDRGRRRDRWRPDRATTVPVTDDPTLLIDRDRLRSTLQALESFCGE